MSLAMRNYTTAVATVADRLNEVDDLIIDANEAMKTKRPKDAWEALNRAKTQLEGAMVSAKWAETLVEER